jgi:hypothetical protein
MTQSEAISSSSAIFLGQVIEIKTKVNSTPGLSLRGSGSGSIDEEVKFSVLRSWKLVDKEYVWVKSQGFQIHCGTLEQGQTYLVYANELTGTLYINPHSRTMRADEAGESIDVGILGPGSVILSQGEFHDNFIQYAGIGIVVVIVIVFVLLIRMIYLRK